MDAPLSPDEWEALGLSLRVAALATLIGAPLAVAAALILARGRFAGRLLLDGLIHLPLVLPPVVTGFLLLVVFGRAGPLGGLIERTFGVRLAFTTQGAVLATLVMTFPLLVRQIRLAIDAIDPGLEQAARTLGARPIDRFLTITLPLMAPGILSGAVLAFVAALGEFGAVVTFAASIPGETRTLPLAIYGALQAPDGEAVAGRLAAIAVILALAGLGLSEILARRLRRRITGRD